MGSRGDGLCRAFPVLGATAAGWGALAGAWNVPWYFDCRHSTEWTEYRRVLETFQDLPLDEDVFWWSHGLLEKTEPIYLRVQDTQHLFHLCDPDDVHGAYDEVEPVPDRPGLESVFDVEGGTDRWTDEERQRRSGFVQDFCYYGYINAGVYRSREYTRRQIPGAEEGRQNAMKLLHTLLLSKSNCMDFLGASSGWPVTLREMLLQLYPPDGPSLISMPAGVELDDTERPAAEVFASMIPQPHGSHSAPGLGDTPQRTWRVAVLGYHTSLALELVSLWTGFLDQLRLEVAGHVLEPGAADPAALRNRSLCRHFQDGEFCAWDRRLLALNMLHVRRSFLAHAKVPSPLVEEPRAFMHDFAGAFRAGSPLEGVLDGRLDRRIDDADLHICTEPALLCGALALAFPDKPIIGYFANPITSYVPARHAPPWLAQFSALAQGAGRSGPFLVVASTRFLAEQVRYQTGVRVLAARPLASYLGPPIFLPVPGRVVVLRMLSIFWNVNCILNQMVRLNHQELGAAHEAGGRVGISVPEMRFVASESLTDGSSEALASFSAAVIFPYDVSQMRLYELYALGVPILLPARAALASYLYRGMTTIEDFNHVLLGKHRADGAAPGTIGEFSHGAPHFAHNPWNRDSWVAAAAWSELTHWATLPHLVYCDGAADMLLHLAHDDLRPLVAGMRKRQERDLVRGVQFWATALASVGIT